MKYSLDHVACQSKNVQIIGSMQPRKRSASAFSEIIRVKSSPCAAIRVFSVHPFVDKRVFICFFLKVHAEFLSMFF